MNIQPGSRLGPYEIEASIGAGGMGEVYRARDTRLDREVAIKVVKGLFTERFEREARAISALNHSHICTLHDVGEHQGIGYLVMELVDGKPIAGPLPVEQALAYAGQICEALHAAHRRGIVHRDLKPGNILLTKAGVKLLDFGLAKMGVTAAAGAGAGVSVEAERATLAPLTGAHTIVGTPQYMAPEQIEGGEIDARTDIFSFGCVLYELITGKRAFEGKSTSSIMAAVLATTPKAMDELVPLTPPALERVVARCLAKDPDDRWQSAKDIGAELEWIAGGGSRIGLPAVVSIRRRVRERLEWGAFALAAVAAIAFAVAWAQRAPTPQPVVRFAVPTPDGTTDMGPPAVSPDGRMIAFDGADSSGQRHIWVRSLDSMEPRMLAGTEGVLRPFWSPDSRYLAFIAGGKLRKIDVTGGPAQTICDAPSGADGSWSKDGVILFDGRGDDPILRVPASGGIPKAEVTGSAEAGQVGWPDFLPDGRHFLYVTYGGPTGEQQLHVRALDSQESKLLLATSSRVRYADPGYLLYVREQTLVAQPFDAKRLDVTGEPIPIGEGLGVDNVGLASFSISQNGVVALRAGETGGYRLVWHDRTGKEVGGFEEVRNYRDVWFSPDGSRAVFDVVESAGEIDLWIKDFARGVTSRFTNDPGPDLNPIWSPDGRRIVYTSRAGVEGDLMIKDASGTRLAEKLLATPEEKYVSDWSRDGKHLIYISRGADTGWDLWALPMQGEAKPVPIVQTRFNDMFGSLSPDGRYVAYHSNESGRNEVYVQEFPEPRNKWQVSTRGGSQPFWRGDGRELFYRSADSRMTSVPLQATGEFKAGAPQALFQTRFAGVIARGHFRPSADGQRFLVLAPPARDAAEPTQVVLNWTSRF